MPRIMQTVTLPYGRSAFAFSFDPERFQVVVPREASQSARQDFLIESPPLADIGRGRRVLLIVSDLTRPTGSLEFLPLLMQQLQSASETAFLFSTGLHRPLGAEDKVAIVGETIFQSYPMLDHWPDRDNVYIGTTSRGNRIDIDKQILDYDVVVLTGSIGFHYFAGFTGGRKSLVPGVAAQNTIRFNHLLVLDQHGSGRNPDVRVARLDGNPVNEDLIEAAQLVEKRLFVFNTILDRSKRVAKIYQGHWYKAHRAGCADYFRTHSFQLKERRRFAIASAGGFPRDINMIQSHKAYEFAQHAVEPGGTIILLAECSEGTGHQSFFPWFRHTDLDEFERNLREHYEVYGQTAYSLLSKARRFTLILVSSLDAAVVRTMGLVPARSLEEAMEIAEQQVRGSSGYILPFSADVLPVVE
jgi:nickel-dependent lactate racemase